MNLRAKVLLFFDIYKKMCSFFCTAQIFFVPLRAKMVYYGSNGNIYTWRVWSD